MKLKRPIIAVAVLLAAGVALANPTIIGAVIRLERLALASFPAASALNEGGLLYDDTNNEPKYSNGSTWASMSPSGMPAYTTALDLDFSAEGTQTLSSDTTYTIGGLTWTKINSVNDAVAMTVTNGSGLIVQPGATSDYNSTTRTLPAITLPISSASASINYTSALRVWVYIAATNATGNYHNAVLGVESGGTLSAYIVKAGYDNGLNGKSGWINFAGTPTTRLQQTGAPFTTNDVIVLDLPHGIIGAHMMLSAGTYSAGFPAYSALLPASTTRISAVTPNATAISGWRVLLGAQRAGAGVTLSVTIGRLKIEYLN